MVYMKPLTNIPASLILLLCEVGEVLEEHNSLLNEAAHVSGRKVFV